MHLHLLHLGWACFVFIIKYISFYAGPGGGQQPGVPAEQEEGGQADFHRDRHLRRILASHPGHATPHLAIVLPFYVLRSEFMV